VQAIAAAFKAPAAILRKASEWLKANSGEASDGQKSLGQQGDLKVSDYVVYQWDDKGNIRKCSNGTSHAQRRQVFCRREINIRLRGSRGRYESALR
jgi:hypothetical protein